MIKRDVLNIETSSKICSIFDTGSTTASKENNKDREKIARTKMLLNSVKDIKRIEQEIPDVEMYSLLPTISNKEQQASDIKKITPMPYDQRPTERPLFSGESNSFVTLADIEYMFDIPKVVVQQNSLIGKDERRSHAIYDIRKFNNTDDAEEQKANKEEHSEMDEYINRILNIAIPKKE